MCLDFFRKASCSLLTFATASASMHAEPVQINDSSSGSEILWALQKLDTLGRVLYVAAHPDDENTNLIAYLSLGRKYDTAYLSLTRGDGGQNLIGSELRDELGVIRTQELQEARRLDGGSQYFSRAKDFGFSKHPDETFGIWNREDVLADTVWVIRNFQPDVIVTRFNPEPGYTHGHHTASTILALEAFEAAADQNRFPEQLEFTKTWQAKRVLWNTSTWFFRNSGAEFIESEYAKLDVGGYDPLLGKSYNEIASASRSKHLSQGFGTRIDRGSRIEYFKHLAGEGIESDMFDGIDASWSRVDDSDTIQAKVKSLIEEFDVAQPELSVKALLELREELAARKDSTWPRRKQLEVERILFASMGANLKALSGSAYVRNGEPLPLTLEMINRSHAKARLVGVSLPFAESQEDFSIDLGYNEPVEIPVAVDIPRSTPFPQPYWLETSGTLGMFDVGDQFLIGKAENDPVFSVLATLEVEGVPITVELPVQYREVDPAKGETMRPVLNLPEASVAFSAPVSLFPNFESKPIEVSVSALLTEVSGRLELVLPEGWNAEPSFHEVTELREGAEKSYTFLVTPMKRSEEVSISARLTTEFGDFDKAVSRIEYEHIGEQTVFTPAATQAVSLEVARAGQKVGYLAGAGDTVPDSIREIGFEVVDLSPDGFKKENLEGLDTVVIGIRAYNTIDGIGAIMDELFDFAKSGGTVIAQYNTSRGLKTDKLAPFALSLSRDRVTDETAEVTVLAPGHPVLNGPNKITQRDFTGWTQERGLYFPDSWDAAFTPILAINDPGEPSLEGSLLVAKYGEGYFVYTGLSWFRQLPAGVPGAYRIFANLLSLGHSTHSKEDL